MSRWDDLSMGDRAALISLFIKEGVSDPKVMRRLYDEGGDAADIKPAVSNASYPREREVLDLVNNSKADFVSRLIDENRATIPDWNNKDDIATHKLSYARDGDRWIIYPNVQNIDGKLYDFSDPKYGLDKGLQALDSALYSGDYVEVPSEADARWFTESYKNHYPGFNKYKDGGNKNSSVDAISGADVPAIDTDPQKSKTAWFNWWYKFREDQIDANRKASDSLTSKKRYKRNFLKSVNDRLNAVGESYNDINGKIEAPEFISPASEDSVARKQILDFGSDYKLNDYDESARIVDYMVKGFYTPYYKHIIYNPEYNGIPNDIMVHERTHSLGSTPYYNSINKAVSKFKKNGVPITVDGVDVNKYLDSGNEVYARLNAFRYANNLNPSHIYSKEEIGRFRRDGLLKEYDLDRYTDDYIYFLINGLADSNEDTGSKSDVNSAAFGGLFNNRYDGKTEKSQKMVRLSKDNYLVPEELKPSVVTPDSNKEKITIPIDYLFPERDDVGYKLDTLRDVMQSIVDRDKKVRSNPLETLKGYNSAYRNPFIENPYYRNYINYGYNRFDKGGKSDSYNTGEIKEYNWNAFDTWAARHPQTMMRLRKAKTLANDLLALHPVLGIYDDIMDYINQKPQEDRDAKDEINSITTATGLGGKIVNILYGKPVKKIFNDSEWSNAFKKFSNILNIPDKINDSIKFIDDFSRPVNEFDKGGDTIDKPRVDYIMKDLPLRAAVYDLSKQYGVSPAAIFYRLGREGAVDARIRDRYYIGEGNQMSMIDSGSLDEYDMNDAFGYYGLDDTFERYKKGQIHTRRKIPFALGVAVNEKGRLTSSIDDTFSRLNQYDMLELMAAELEGFKNMAKKAYPGKDEDWYDRAAVTGYNRGPGFIKWLKTNDPYDISAYSGITDSGYKSNNAKPNTIDVPHSSHVNSYYDDMLKIYNTIGPMLPSGREMRRYNFLKSIGIRDSDMLDYKSLNKAFVTEPDITEPINYTRPYLNTGYKFMSGGKIRNK